GRRPLPRTEALDGPPGAAAGAACDRARAAISSAAGFLPSSMAAHIYPIEVRAVVEEARTGFRGQPGRDPVQVPHRLCLPGRVFPGRVLEVHGAGPGARPFPAAPPRDPRSA